MSSGAWFSERPSAGPSSSRLGVATSRSPLRTPCRRPHRLVPGAGYVIGTSGVGPSERTPPPMRRTRMPTAREIMSPRAEWVSADASVHEVARKLASEDYGGLPVCDGQGHLQGFVTDRDLVVKV